MSWASATPGDWFFSFPAQLVLRATALLLVALGAAWLLRRGSAALRRQLWVGTAVALLLLPLAGVVVPPLRVPLAAWPGATAPLGPPAAIEGVTYFPLRPRPANPAVVAGAAAASTGDPVRARAGGGQGVRTALAALYLAGLLLAGLRLTRARLRAGRLLRGARPVGAAWPVLAGIDVRESDAVDLPITVRALRPVVLVPAAGRTWLPAWQRAVLAHEAAHVRARDPLTQLLAELAAALYWFHPLVHQAARRLRIERELAADDQALATGLRPSEYAGLLYELACLPGTPPAIGAVVPLLTPQGLKARVLGVLDATRARATRPALRIAVAGLGLCAFVPLAAAIPVARDGRGLAVGRGAIVGRLLDAGTGQPVAGAEVGFRFNEFPPRTVRVLADDAGWFRYPWSAPLPRYFGVYAQKDDRAGRSSILAVPHGTTLPIQLALARAQTVSGTVVATGGEPVAGARVSIMEDDASAFGPGRAIAAETDAAGRWRLRGLLYGKYRLLVAAPWGVKTTRLVVVDDRDIEDLVTEVPASWPITGYLRDDTGAPLPNVRVDYANDRVYVSSWPVPQVLPDMPQERHVDWDESAADGSFRLMPRGRRVAVLARRADGVVFFGDFESKEVKDLSDGNDASEQRRAWRAGRDSPITVDLRQGARVSGVVRRDDGRPVANALVAVKLRDAMFAHDVPPVTTDEQGRFSVPAVPPTALSLVAAQLRAGSSFPQIDGEARLALLPGSDRSDVEIVLGASAE